LVLDKVLFLVQLPHTAGSCDEAASRLRCEGTITC